MVNQALVKKTGVIITIDSIIVLKVLHLLVHNE